MNFKTFTYLFIFGLFLNIIHQLIFTVNVSEEIIETYSFWLVTMAVIIHLTKILFFWMFIRYFKPKRTLLIIALFGIIICSLFRMALIPQINVFAIEEISRLAIKSLFVNLESVFLLVFIGEILKMIPDVLAVLKRSALVSYYAHLSLILLFIFYTAFLMLGVNSNQFIEWANSLKMPLVTIDIMIFAWFILNLAKNQSKLSIED